MASAERPIYLDHHATTPVDPRVLAAMWPWFTEKFGNAGSIDHAYGREAAEAVARAREQVAALLKVPPEGIIFTSGATESNNLALKGIVRATARGHIVSTAIEHKAILSPLKRLSRRGTGMTLVPVDHEGRVNPDDIARALRPETVLVSVMWANNEVGTIQPIAEIASLCRERGIFFHTDAAQAVGKIPLDLAAFPIDLLSISGHKLYGPQGIGALYVRQGEPRILLEPLLDGGGQENNLRSGTVPVPLAVGFGKACEIARLEMSSEAQRLQQLRDLLQQELRTKLCGVTVNGPERHRLPGNLHVSFEGVDGAALLASLTKIAVSSGSACTTKNPAPSHVLRAMGISEKLSLASLRFGLGRSTTDEEIRVAAAHVIDVVERLRIRSS